MSYLDIFIIKNTRFQNEKLSDFFAFNNGTLLIVLDIPFFT